MVRNVCQLSTDQGNYGSIDLLVWFGGSGSHRRPQTRAPRDVDWRLQMEPSRQAQEEKVVSWSAGSERHIGVAAKSNKMLLMVMGIVVVLLCFGY
mmetsp:Transcript_5118/g.11155  ORF Transcript_5118/g.11155 Transcript_5118/m.11155 type:complete len:95 (-) Transcript_5118:54-338(-)